MVSAPEKERANARSRETDDAGRTPVEKETRRDIDTQCTVRTREKERETERAREKREREREREKRRQKERVEDPRDTFVIPGCRCLPPVGPKGPKKVSDGSAALTASDNGQVKARLVSHRAQQMSSRHFRCPDPPLTPAIALKTAANDHYPCFVYPCMISLFFGG